MKAYKPKDAVYTRIESGDDWSKVYQHVCGVPTDGTEVQAEAFVLGEARVVEITRRRDGMIDITTPEGGVLTPSCGIEFGDLCFPIGRIKPGETRRIRIVPEPVAAETPSQRAVQAVSKMAEQLVQGDLDDSEGGAGVPVAADIPKGAAEKETEVPQHSWYKPDPCETFLMRYGDSDVWFGTGSDLCSAPYTRRIGKNLDDGGPYPLSIEIAPGEYWWEAAHLAARAKARELGLMESGIVSESKGADVSEKPKVWLMRHRVGGYRVSSGQLQPKYNKDRDTWDVDESGWVKHVPDEIVPLIHPAHNLKPGECCEVPAREDDTSEKQRREVAQKTIDRLKKFSDALESGKPLEQCGYRVKSVSTGARDLVCHVEESVPPVAPPVEHPLPRFPKPIQWAMTNPENWETFLCNADGEIDFYLSKDRKLITTSGDKVTWGMMEVADLESWVKQGGDARWLVALERARQLGLVGAEGGGDHERWPLPQFEASSGRSIGEFIGRFEGKDFYVGTSRRHKEPACIWRIGEGGSAEHMRLFPQPHYDTLAAFFRLCHDDDALLWKTAYDAALAANKLPPHPRYPKPEGATDWLGWTPGTKPNTYDAWYGDGRLFLVYASGKKDWDSMLIERVGDRPNQFSGDWTAALTRAKELGLPERDARKARLADLERQRAEIDGQIAALREVSNA